MGTGAAEGKCLYLWCDIRNGLLDKFEDEGLDVLVKLIFWKCCLENQIQESLDVRKGI